MATDIQVNPPMIQQTILRLAQGGSKIDMPTGMQKFKMFLAKAGSFIGRIGGSLLSMVPGWGKALSPLLYGLGNVSQKNYEKQVNTRMTNLQMDEMATQNNANYLTPGFGMFGSPAGVVSPSIPDGYLSQERANAVNNRDQASYQAVQNMS